MLSFVPSSSSATKIWLFIFTRCVSTCVSLHGSLCVWILYTYFSSLLVDALEKCLCICFLVYVCSNVHMTMQALWQMLLSVWNAVGWLSPERVTRERHHWRATATFSGPEKVQICFYLWVGGKKAIAEKTTTNDQLHFFFLPSLSLSISSSLTLSGRIPTLHLHYFVAAESISRDASLGEKKTSFTVSLLFYRSH